MSRFDEEDLIALGFGAMSPEDRADLAARLRDELEVRVGRALSEGMTEEDLEEFEALSSGDAARAWDWLSAHQPFYLQDRRFQLLLARRVMPDETNEVMCEWAASQWLEEHRPDYPEVTKRVSEEICAELLSYRDRLLAATAAG